MANLEIIKIKNIKGIEYKEFNINAVANKPNILVAPNGFGKSSFATAFKSLNKNKIQLRESDYYCGNSENLPQITISYRDDAGETHELIADDSQNAIKDEIAYFVINCRTEAKGIKRYKGGISARIEIPDIVLINTIPSRGLFNYSFRERKQVWGCNSKVLPNITNSILGNQRIVSGFKGLYMHLERANGARIQRCIQDFIERLNQQNQGNKTSLLQWIVDNELRELSNTNYIKDIAQYLYFECNIDLQEVECYLAAIELVWLFNNDQNTFKAACEYNEYLLKKETFQELLRSLNPTWQDIHARESNDKLVVKFPNANLISNGQRDILTFVSMLFKAKASLNKRMNILIIDEVFDYLDDANLIAAQYYITKFIEDFKNEDRSLFPLILTHLNPYYFKNYSFNKMKVHFLDQSNMSVTHALKELLRKREEPSIKDDVSKYLLHFHPETINKRKEFQRLHLRETWGEGQYFSDFIRDEARKYISGEPYDPFAVCCAVRNKIEEIAYRKLVSDADRESYIKTHKTRAKLDFVKAKGHEIPETHYLLGIIYNEAMHWKEDADNITPIAVKLEHKVIQHIIKTLFRE